MLTGATAVRLPAEVGDVELAKLVNDITDALVAVDRSRVAHKQFRPGVGPYGERELVRLIKQSLDTQDNYAGLVEIKRNPDLLIRGKWALEFKLARPFGDNGVLAENWSVNLLHPYPGNFSALGDCLKLLEWAGPERRASIVIGYEHEPAQLSLDPLIRSFEVIATEVLLLQLGSRLEVTRSALVHPVHQRARVFAWEVQGRRAEAVRCAAPDAVT
jgi:hypothetical protein